MSAAERSVESPTAPGGMLVVGAGFPRTGTASLQRALEILLDKPCYHMYEVMKHKHHAAWAAVYRDGWAAHKGEMLQLLQPYAASVDMPVMMMYKEVMAAYPDVKVLLSARDFDAWHRSVHETVYQSYKLRWAVPWYARWIDHAMEPTLKELRVVMDAFFGPKGLFQGKFEDKAFAKQIFDDWNASVKLTVPEDKLLVFNVKEGWGPLCKFLGVPLPEGQEFPNVNESAGFQARIIQPRKRKVALLTWLPPIVAAAVPAAAIAIAKAAARHK